MLANASGGHAVVLDKADALNAAAWSPDGQWICLVRRGHGDRNKLAKIRATLGASPVILAEAERPVGSVTQWSLRGDWILYRHGDAIKLISPDGKSARKLIHADSQPMTFRRTAASIGHLPQYGGRWAGVAALYGERERREGEVSHRCRFRA
jgi:hypothetical protein